MNYVDYMWILTMRYIYCHPLFDERKCSHRFSYHLKNSFHIAGLTLERFDYRGTGENEGKFEDVSLETLRQDVVSKVKNDEVSLIGLRFGASLALDYCVYNKRTVRKLILLEPIVDGIVYIDYLYRKQYIKDLMTIKSFDYMQDADYANFEGYKTNLSFIEQTKNFHLIEMIKDHAIADSVYIVQISKRKNIEQGLSKLAEALKIHSKKVFIEKIELPVFWERIPSTDYTKLTQKLLMWCYD